VSLIEKKAAEIEAERQNALATPAAAAQ
jgi:hypothetical protein